ncbi:MAG TPA: glycoside hydrolase family 2 TIM barrel-domain containing protein [Solirubrobacteraceae bacterium]|nr:glycoside hydrolase family 2 TIM barrel-domain containing protein [Solirubrobacteraceae bacterium]
MNRPSRSRGRLTLAALAAAVAALASAASAEGPKPRVTGPGGSVPLTRWTVREDPAARGDALGWRRGSFAGAPVTVPDVMHPNAFQGRAGTRNYEGSVAWYRTTYRAPSAGIYALDFASANFLATVWVDGRAVGSHRGSYLPFELRARLAAGPHTIVVRVDWRNPGAQSRAGFHRTWFNWGGIDGGVRVRAIGASDLSEPALQTTLSGAGARVEVSVRVRNEGSERTLQPVGSLVRGGESVAIPFGELTLAHGESATARATVTIPSPALWSPAAPNLYELELSVPGESTYDERVGLRQLTWHGGRMYLNGVMLRLHGATIQEDAPGHGDALTEADDERLVAELRAVHANAVRAQHPLDATLLAKLDEAGIVVWQGVGPVEGAGNWFSDTPRLNAEAEQRARSAIAAEQIHPSVIAWNLVDEVAGNGRNSYEVSYVQTLTHWLHAHDPTRLVAVDVWGDHPPRQPGSLFAGVDAVAETDYTGWYDAPSDTPAQLVALMRARLSAMARAFPGRVLVISEFGAESNSLNAGQAPGSYGFQASLLEHHIAVYERDPRLSGMLIWLLRDYPLTPTFEGGSIHAKLPGVRLIEGINQKGLFERGGIAKPAARAVARLFAALPAM